MDRKVEFSIHYDEVPENGGRVSVRLNDRYVSGWFTVDDVDTALNQAEEYLAAAFDQVLTNISGTFGIGI